MEKDIMHCCEKNNYSKYGKNKKLHYELTKKYFRESAVYKEGYYDAETGGELKHDMWQRNIWRICISILDKILQNNSEITKVIDVGCGRGDFTIDIAKRYPQFQKIVGIDFLKETIDIAYENAKQFNKVSFIKEDLLNLPFNDRIFDVTICINVLHHVHIEDFERAVRELSRITEKYLILEIRNKKNILNFWYNHITLPIFYRDLPIYTCSISELSSLIRNHNFKLQIARGIFPASWVCRRLILLYKRIDID